MDATGRKGLGTGGLTVATHGDAAWWALGKVSVRRSDVRVWRWRWIIWIVVGRKPGLGSRGAAIDKEVRGQDGGITEMATAVIQESAGFELKISSEWVELGLIPWNPAVAELMAAYAGEDRKVVSLEGLRDTPMPGQADFLNQAFTIRSSRWMGTDRERSYLVDVVEGDPLRICFRPTFVYSAAERGNDGRVTDDDVRLLFTEVVTANEETESGFELRQAALKLQSRPGFDVLLAPEVVREVTLFDYQLNTVRRVLQDMRGRALLADEVGLGKTIEAAMVLMEYILRGLVKSALILCPSSLVGQWREELQRKFNWPFVTHDDEVFRKSSDPFAEYPWLIASIDTLKRSEWADRVKASAYDLIIVDEAHHLKNDKTLAYRLVSSLPKKFILLLTATPVENRLDELFTLITLLSPGHLATKEGFRRRFIEAKDPLKPKNPDELRRLLRGVMIRNRRSTTGVIATHRTAHTLEIIPSIEEQQFYQQVSAFVRDRYQTATNASVAGFHRLSLKTLQKELGSSVAAVVPTLTRIAEHSSWEESDRQQLNGLIRTAAEISDHRKIARLLDFIARVGDEKMVIFTGYRRTQELIVAEFAARGIGCVEFHGQLSRAAKDAAVARFADDVPILISTESGGEGRNLQFCHYMVNFDLPWNPLRIEQRIGRIHRIGQTKDVHIYNLVAENTVEAEVLRVLDAKLNMFQLVVGELDMILGKRSNEQDFEEAIMQRLTESASHEEFRARMEDLGEEYRNAKLAYEKVKATDQELFDELTADA